MWEREGKGERDGEWKRREGDRGGKREVVEGKRGRGRDRGRGICFHEAAEIRRPW